MKILNSLKSFLDFKPVFLFSSMTPNYDVTLLHLLDQYSISIGFLFLIQKDTLSIIYLVRKKWSNISCMPLMKNSYMLCQCKHSFEKPFL